MRIPQLLLALVVATAALLAAAAAVAPQPGDLPAPHPDHPTLLVGGAAFARSGVLLALGWAYGALALVFFAACFALGMQRDGSLGPLRRPLWGGTAVYLAIWTALVASYAVYARDPGGPLWGSFPAPTAWLFYGLWPFPAWFAWLYVRHFDDWVLRDGGGDA